MMGHVGKGVSGVKVVEGPDVLAGEEEREG